MADYQRLVSYMYRYEKGMKRNNVGYLRLETRNNQLRTTIHLQIPPTVECIFPTYFISWKQGKVSLVFLGDTVAKNQSVDTRINTESRNIQNSGFSFEEIGGLIILADEQVFYATEWCNHDIEWEQIMEALRAPKEEDELKASELVSQKENQLELAYERDGFIHPNLFAGCEDKEGPKHIFDHTATQEMTNAPVIVREIFSNCPKMYPFEDQEILSCVKLDLQDINRFPSDISHKVSNSFLLHGYYSYHHIIFVMLKEHNEEHYFLGVPGIFQHREKNMARLFGFEYFKGIRRKELVPGEFGYWFIRVDL